MIEIKNLSKSYGNTLVLSDFSATIPAHQITYLSGKSGVGKTTLLRIISGLEVYSSGTIYGLENLKISILFQENRLIENLSIYTNIALPHLPHLPSNFASIVTQSLETIGLTIPLTTKVNTLSGGMKRRVALIRSVLAPFDLLILDEPFTGLDLMTKTQTITYLNTMIQDKTVLLVSHHPEDLGAFSIQSHISL